MVVSSKRRLDHVQGNRVYAHAGRPQRQKFDEFWCRHPPMDLGKRAKIFAPFAALKGFDKEIRAAERRAALEQVREIEYIPVDD